jgi:isocitrate/isopropylmalate dehydrogenase
MVLCAKMMLDWLGEGEAARMIEGAVFKVLSEGRVVTYDLGGKAKTSEMGEEIARHINQQ